MLLGDKKKIHGDTRRWPRPILKTAAAGGMRVDQTGQTSSRTVPLSRLRAGGKAALVVFFAGLVLMLREYSQGP